MTTLNGLRYALETLDDAELAAWFKAVPADERNRLMHDMFANAIEGMPPLQAALFLARCLRDRGSDEISIKMDTDGGYVVGPKGRI